MKIQFNFLRPIAILLIITSTVEVCGNASLTILNNKIQTNSNPFFWMAGIRNTNLDFLEVAASVHMASQDYFDFHLFNTQINKIQKAPSGFKLKYERFLKNSECSRITNQFDEDSVFLKDSGSRKFVIKSLPYFGKCRVFTYKDFASKIKLDSFKTHEKGFQYYIEPTEEDAGHLYLINAKKSKIFKIYFDTQSIYAENYDFGFHKWKYDSKGNCKCIIYNCRLISCIDYPVFKRIEKYISGCAA